MEKVKKDKGRKEEKKIPGTVRLVSAYSVSRIQFF